MYVICNCLNVLPPPKFPKLISAQDNLCTSQVWGQCIWNAGLLLPGVQWGLEKVGSTCGPLYCPLRAGPSRPLLGWHSWCWRLPWLSGSLLFSEFLLPRSSSLPLARERKMWLSPEPRWEWHIIPIKGRLSNTNGRLPEPLLLDSEGRWKSRL